VKIAPIAAQLRGSATELVGGVNSITAGVAYWVLAGVVNGKARGRFVATSADVAAFTDASQRVSLTPFAQRVWGAAEFPITDQEVTSAIIPSAYVVFQGVNASEQELSGGFYQGVTRTFQVAIFLANDRGPSGAQNSKLGVVANDEMFNNVQHYVFSRLLNWTPPDGSEPISLQGTALVELNRRYAVYVITFISPGELDESDGFDPGPFPPFLTFAPAYSILEDDPILIGGTDQLTEGERYYILGAPIDVFEHGVFIATSDAVDDFTEATQQARRVRMAVAFGVPQ
jgi:hypothetical protein